MLDYFFLYVTKTVPGALLISCSAQSVFHWNSGRKRPSSWMPRCQLSESPRAEAVACVHMAESTLVLCTRATVCSGAEGCRSLLWWTKTSLGGVEGVGLYLWVWAQLLILNAFLELVLIAKTRQQRCQCLSPVPLLVNNIVVFSPFLYKEHSKVFADWSEREESPRVPSGLANCCDKGKWQPPESCRMTFWQVLGDCF